MNKLILLGNLTRDPQLSYTPAQMAVCDFGIAVNRRYSTKDGQQKEDILFIDCQAWGKQGEVINQHFTKGKQILAEGRLTFDQWEDKNGQKRSKHRMTVERFDFVGPPPQQGQASYGERQAAPPMAPPQAPPPPAPPQPGDYGPPNTQHQPPPQTSPPNTNKLYEEAEAAGGDKIPF